MPFAKYGVNFREDVIELAVKIATDEEYRNSLLEDLL